VVFCVTSLGNVPRYMKPIRNELRLVPTYLFQSPSFVDGWTYLHICMYLGSRIPRGMVYFSSRELGKYVLVCT